MKLEINVSQKVPPILPYSHGYTQLDTHCVKIIQFTKRAYQRNSQIRTSQANSSSALENPGTVVY